jgi:hypothetical protein
MKTRKYQPNTKHTHREPTAMGSVFYLSHHQAVQDLQQGVTYNSAYNAIQDLDCIHKYHEE